MIAADIFLLPNEPIFSRLIELARDAPNTVLVRDSTHGINATCSQLLKDVQNLRQTIYYSLDESMFDPQSGLILEEAPYVCILAPGNYEFIVAALAILAFGGAVVPIPTGTLPEEALNLIQRSKSRCILAAAEYMSKAMDVKKYAQSEGQLITVLPISATPGGEMTAVTNVRPVRDVNMTVPQDRPALLIFTSGTTGQPKGVVHLRKFFYADTVHDEGVYLCHQSPHWLRGMCIIMRRPLSGYRIEIVESSPRAIWEKIRSGDADSLFGVPRLYAALQKYYHEHLRYLPPDELLQYTTAIRSLKGVRTVGTIVPRPVMEFWCELLGRPLMSCYSTTELGGLGLGFQGTHDGKDRTIGQPHPGVDVKLSDGDHGELRIKCPTMFSKYLDDPVATESAFDEEGYFKTGDYVHRDGDEYIIDGRISTDFFQYAGFRVPILELESKIMELPYVCEAIVVCVQRADAGKHVGVLLVPESKRSSDGSSTINLRSLRADLLDKIPAYQLPTALRILRDGETIPKTAAGKLNRRQVNNLYFSCTDDSVFDEELEICGMEDNLPSSPRKAWDWAGMRS